MLHRLFTRLDHRRMAWISMGVLRTTPAPKRTMRERFPAARFLSGEQVPCPDGKMRYFQPLRVAMYRNMRQWVREAAPLTPLSTSAWRPGRPGTMCSATSRAAARNWGTNWQGRRSPGPERPPSPRLRRARDARPAGPGVPLPRYVEGSPIASSIKSRQDTINQRFGYSSIAGTRIDQFEELLIGTPLLVRKFGKRRRRDGFVIQQC